MVDAKYVVVGGSKGIGFGIVQRLVAGGNQVVVISRTPAKLSSLQGVTHVRADLTCDEVQADSLPGKIAGIAYCPGTLQLKPFRALKPDVFRSDFELNVVGAVKVIQAALPGLKAADDASIVLFSTVAVRIGMHAHASVAASKGAVEGLARTLASELAPKVRVNCIAPALTDTPLTSRFFANPEKATAMGDMYPLKRTGTVADMASMAHFLLSEESSWVTGQVIGVDGGMSAVK